MTEVTESTNEQGKTVYSVDVGEMPVEEVEKILRRARKDIESRLLEQNQD